MHRVLRSQGGCEIGHVGWSWGCVYVSSSASLRKQSRWQQEALPGSQVCLRCRHRLCTVAGQHMLVPRRAAAETQQRRITHSSTMPGHPVCSSTGRQARYRRIHCGEDSLIGVAIAAAAVPAVAAECPQARACLALGCYAARITTGWLGVDVSLLATAAGTMPCSSSVTPAVLHRCDHIISHGPLGLLARARVYRLAVLAAHACMHVGRCMCYACHGDGRAIICDRPLQ